MEWDKPSLLDNNFSLLESPTNGFESYRTTCMAFTPVDEEGLDDTDIILVCK